MLALLTHFCAACISTDSTQLSVSHNKLDSLGGAIKKCYALTELRISHNRLKVSVTLAPPVATRPQNRKSAATLLTRSMASCVKSCGY